MYQIVQVFVVIAGWCGLNGVKGLFPRYISKGELDSTLAYVRTIQKNVITEEGSNAAQTLVNVAAFCNVG